MVGWLVGVGRGLMSCRNRALYDRLAVRDGPLSPEPPDGKVSARGRQLVYDRAGDAQGGGCVDALSACIGAAGQVGGWSEMKAFSGRSACLFWILMQQGAIL